MIVPGDDFQIGADHRTVQGGRSLADTAAISLNALAAGDGACGQITQRTGSGVAGSTVKGEHSAGLENSAVHGFQCQLHVVVAVGGVGGIGAEGAQLLHMGSHFGFGFVELHHFGGNFYGADFVALENGHDVLEELIMIHFQAVFAVLIGKSSAGGIEGNHRCVHRVFFDVLGELVQLGLYVFIGNFRFYRKVLFTGSHSRGRSFRSFTGGFGSKSLAVGHGILEHLGEIKGKHQVILRDVHGVLSVCNRYFIGSSQLILRLFQQGQRFLPGLSGNVNAADGHALCIGHVFGLDGRSGGKRAFRRGVFRRRGVPGGVDHPDDNADGDEDDQHSGNANGDEFLLFG